MSITVKNISVPSSDGIHDLAGVVYIPNTEIKGIFHIVHGMTEHTGRYNRIMTDLALNGYLCVAYDCLGHGHTVKNANELGYFADKNGWKLLIKDVKAFAEAIKAEYGSNLPYYLMGHSMGSFIVRLTAEKHFTPDKLIIMGTGGPNPAAGIGLFVISIIKVFRGGHHISKFVNNLAFGGFKKNKSNNSQTGSWLTTDHENRKKYWSEELPSFKFTVSGMWDLIKLMKHSNRKAWFKSVSADLPILLLSGDEDPVCKRGAGIIYITAQLKKRGKNAEYILYKGARHEILNDFSYDDVAKDILNFIK